MESLTLTVWEKCTTFEEWQEVYKPLLYQMFGGWLNKVSREAGVQFYDIGGEYQNLCVYHYKKTGPEPPDWNDSYPIPEWASDKSIKWPEFANKPSDRELWTE